MPKFLFAMVFLVSAHCTRKIIDLGEILNVIFIAVINSSFWCQFYLASTGQKWGLSLAGVPSDVKINEDGLSPCEASLSCVS